MYLGNNYDHIKFMISFPYFFGGVYVLYIKMHKTQFVHHDWLIPPAPPPPHSFRKEPETTLWKVDFVLSWFLTHTDDANSFLEKLMVEGRACIAYSCVLP